MANYKIESGISIPFIGKSHNSKYPFCDMEVGDSFFVDVLPGRSINSKLSSLNNCAKLYASKHEGTQFTSRKEEAGIRVWRIS